MGDIEALVAEALDSGVLMHAAQPGVVIHTNTPGLSVDGAEMRERLVKGMLATPAGQTLARWAAIGEAVERMDNEGFLSWSAHHKAEAALADLTEAFRIYGEGLAEQRDAARADAKALVHEMEWGHGRADGCTHYCEEGHFSGDDMAVVDGARVTAEAERDAARADAKALAEWVEAALNERADHEEGVRLLAAHEATQA